MGLSGVDVDRNEQLDGQVADKVEDCDDLISQILSLPDIDIRHNSKTRVLCWVPHKT